MSRLGFILDRVSCDIGFGRRVQPEHRDWQGHRVAGFGRTNRGTCAKHPRDNAKPTFPKWLAVWPLNRPTRPPDQAFFAPRGVCGRGNNPDRSDQAATPCRAGAAALFFSAVDRPVEPLSFGLGLDHGHAQNGGARKRWIAARMARTIGPVTATSESWKVMARAWRTTRAPILISLSWRLVSDQSAMASGSPMQRKKVARL